MTLQIKPERGVEFQRNFTSTVDDFGDWAEIEPLFINLEKQGGEIDSPGNLEKWLLDQSELAAALDEEYSRRYIAMTCNTEDPELEKAYLDYLENVVPKTGPHWDRLHRLYLDSPHRAGLPRRRFEVLDRQLANDVALFREENIPLKTENSKLSQAYQKICGAMTVMWEGEEKTLQQMAKYLEETDRELREKVWRLVSDRRMRDNETINVVLDEMIRVRTKIARNAGFDNYRDYQHQAYGRFDYTPADCIAFQDAVAEHFVPLKEKLNAERRRDLGLGSLRPWDFGVDPKGREPLRPFDSSDKLQDGCEKIFRRVGEEFGRQFADMRRLGLLDLDSRRGKAPGGYQSTLEEIRYPFIFMNAAGTDRDVYTLLHEGGHAFHAFASREEPIVSYRSAPIEFCEVASMTMELFAYDYLDSVYEEADAARSRRQHNEKLVDIFPWIATIDAFQHWLYLNPDHTRSQREEKWLEIEERFSPGTDWSGLDAEHRSQWQRQLHIFQCPFYYIEYGIAQLGALQIWLKSKSDFAGAVASYRAGLALGGSRPLPELFETGGAKFDFSSATIGPIARAIETELGLA